MTTTIPDAPTDQGIVDALDAYAGGWSARDAAWGQLVDELRAQLPADPPPASPALFGCSRPDMLDGAQLDVPIVRTYLPDKHHPSDWSGDSGLMRAYGFSSDALCVSFKDEPGDWLRSLLASSPTDRALYLCQDHEPWSKYGPGKPLPISTYQQRWQTTLAIASEFAHVHTTTILDGSHPESWLAFTVDGADVHGVDRYGTLGAPKTYPAPGEVFGPWLEFVDGKPTGVAETGVTDLGIFTDPKLREQWADEARATLAAEPNVEFGCWWNAGDVLVSRAIMLHWLAAAA